MIDLVARGLFGCAILGLAFLGGYVVRTKQIWPNSVLVGAGSAVQAFWALEVAGYSFSHEARKSGTGVVANEAAASQPGVTFLMYYRDGRFQADLVEADGTVLHHWATTFSEVWGDSAPHVLGRGKDQDIQWHGVKLLPNGDLLFNFEGSLFPYGGGLVRIDRASKVVWKVARNTHHSVTVMEDGTMWVPSMRWHDKATSDFPRFPDGFYEDTVLELAPDGTVRREVSVTRALATVRGLLPDRIQGDDPTHNNDVEVVTAALAPKLKLPVGTLVVSLRNLNTVLALDPEREEGIRVWRGPFVAQHDPDLLPDGRILVFDNKGGNDTRTASRIIALDAVSGASSVLYEGSEVQPFFSEAWGSQQLLANGNLLITETYGGRVFETTLGPDARIVWEYINRLDDDEVGHLGYAERIDRRTLTFLEAPSS